MLDGLQKKWKVSGWRLVLILFTFAIGGSLTGYLGRKLLTVMAVPSGWLWIVAYIIIITLLWPLAVLLVSIPFGQYRFFTRYLKKIGKRFTSGSSRIPASTQPSGSKLNIAIFASGAGSNAQQIINHFRLSTSVNIALIVCNKPGAGVLDIAAREKIPVLLIDKEAFSKGHAYITQLSESKIDFIILAGFLWKIPNALVAAYPGRIVNIHPALLPKYGGKGMYGAHVHAAVLAAGDKESGITIHYVDELYDHGAPIFQARCPVLLNDTIESLANRVHALEHLHYPRVIAEILSA